MTQMTEPAPYDIDGWRLALGLVAGSAIAVSYFAIQFYPDWDIVFIVGAILAAILVPTVGLPLYFLLRRGQLLSVYAAVLAGGLLTMLPYLLFRLYDLSDKAATFAQVNDRIHVVNGRLTSQGVWDYFVWMPLWFLAGGAIGGLIAWIITVGFRVHARRVGD